MQHARIRRLLRWAPRRSQFRELRNVRERVMAAWAPRAEELRSFQDKLLSGLHQERLLQPLADQARKARTLRVIAQRRVL